MFDDEVYSSRYDATKTDIIGWEYTVDNVRIQFSRIPPTHKVWWMRPVFREPDMRKPIITNVFDAFTKSPTARQRARVCNALVDRTVFPVEMCRRLANIALEAAYSED